MIAATCASDLAAGITLAAYLLPAAFGDPSRANLPPASRPLRLSLLRAGYHPILIQ